MRIGYVAKFDSGGNEDENAIHFALEQLGHHVERLRESKGQYAHRLDVDFVLFHHWHDFDSMRRIEVPRVFWCFDLISYPDPTLRERNERRKRWAETVTEICDLGFMTDGDWVAQDRTGKLNWLLQGADERVTGPGKPGVAPSPIIFTGSSRGGGVGRESFVAEMRQRYGRDFCQVQRVHGRELADVVASAKVVVAPDHPSTDRYWSNRVFNTLGFGGFLLHPRCRELEKMYQDGEDVVYYDSRPELHELINHFLPQDELRDTYRQNAHERTVREHLYRHRVEQLVKTVQERLF